VKVEGTRTTPATNRVDISPQERWLSDRDAADRADPYRDQSKILTRGANGELVQRERKVGADGQPVAGEVIEQIDPNAPDLPAAEGDEQRFKLGDVELSGAEIRDLLAHKAETDLRKALVPAKPSEYRLELPKDLKLPEGAQFKVAALNDPVKGPAIQAVQDWAHRNGLSQSQFSEILGLYAASQAHEQTSITNAARAQREALGVTGGARVSAISTWLRGRYGDAAAQPFINTLVMKSQVEVWEDIITRSINGGGGGFRQTGREIETGRISQADYDKMTYGEKKEYAESFAAKQGGRR